MQNNEPMTLDRWLAICFEDFEQRFGQLDPASNAFQSGVCQTADTWMIVTTSQMGEMLHADPDLAHAVPEPGRVSDANMSPMGVFQVLLLERLEEYIAEKYADQSTEEETKEEE